MPVLSEVLKMRVFSFDVFDTVITRTVLHPKDVFCLLQQRLETLGGGEPGTGWLGVQAPDAQGLNLPRQLSGCFWGARVWSEFLARRSTGADDITLALIYQTMSCTFGLADAVSERLLSAELEVESEVLVPIDGAQRLVDHARQTGPVVFISDMYLPAGFIQWILERSGLFLPGDRLYVSGELGLSKVSGKLFRHVLDDLGIQPGQLVHCGDHPLSDGRVPRALGVRLLQEPAGPSAANERFRGYAALFQHLNDVRRARMQIKRVAHV